jgi:hypothetical protein
MESHTVVHKESGPISRVETAKQKCIGEYCGTSEGMFDTAYLCSEFRVLSDGRITTVGPADTEHAR